jgi:ATP-dependent helicase/DNAse subunit B
MATGLSILHLYVIPLTESTFPGGIQMDKRYIVRLSDEERETLQKIISTGKAPAYKIRNANILLKVDADGPNWTMKP